MNLGLCKMFDQFQFKGHVKDESFCVIQFWCNFVLARKRILSRILQVQRKEGNSTFFYLFFFHEKLISHKIVTRFDRHLCACIGHIRIL